MLVQLDVVEQRYRAVLEVLDGSSVTEVARRYGVVRQPVYALQRRYTGDCECPRQSPSRHPPPGGQRRTQPPGPHGLNNNHEKSDVVHHVTGLDRGAFAVVSAQSPAVRSPPPKDRLDCDPDPIERPGTGRDESLPHYDAVQIRARAPNHHSM